MDLIYRFFRPDRKGSTREQFHACCNQTKAWMENGEISADRIILINVFADIRSDLVYERTFNEFRVILEGCLRGVEALNLLAQPPGNGDRVAVGIHVLPPVNYPCTIQKKKINGLPYTLVTGRGDQKLLLVPRIQQDFPENFVFSASEKVFLEMEKILRAEGLNFSNIVRQWNYIEHITRHLDTVSGLKQHYQIFNDVRARYYDKYEFNNGYPAATGIGTYAGGVSVSFYAISGSDALTLPVENPLQSEAYKYSEQVLIGKETFKGSPKSSPRFSRARFVRTSLGSQLFISGTAAVRGEQTIGSTCVEQAEVTIENLKHLLSAENISSYGISPSPDKPEIKYLRIYVKNRDLLEKVRKICSEAFPDIPALYVLSDICRDDLLLEIEGAAAFSKYKVNETHIS